VTKRDLIRSVCRDLNIAPKLAQVAVQKVLDTVLERIATEGRVELRNFGIFEVKRRAAHKARNPRTGENVNVAEKHVVTFCPGKEMQQRIESRKDRHNGPTNKE